ncbi:MAG: HEAT repeat domain-containing protein [Phycisphaeraceae bacterium]|nr:HEAT repeat domain-containing protein [Phycisphaeraceae bacterium]
MPARSSSSSYRTGDLSRGTEAARRSAIIACSKFRNARAVPELCRRFPLETPGNRRHIARALHNIGNPVAIPLLLSSLPSSRGLLRGDIIRALASLGAKEAIPHIQRAAHSSVPWVRESVVWALKRLEQRCRMATIGARIHRQQSAPRTAIAFLDGALSTQSLDYRSTQSTLESDSHEAYWTDRHATSATSPLSRRRNVHHAACRLIPRGLRRAVTHAHALARLERMALDHAGIGHPAVPVQWVLRGSDASRAGHRMDSRALGHLPTSRRTPLARLNAVPVYRPRSSYRQRVRSRHHVQDRATRLGRCRARGRPRFAARRRSSARPLQLRPHGRRGTLGNRRSGPLPRGR